MAELLHMAPRPCSTCPYRPDTPPGIWAPKEYAKLAAYDRDPATGVVPPMAVFCCHQQTATGVPTVCRGWLAVHPDSLAVRLAIAQAALTAGQRDTPCPVELYPSGTAAARAGRSGITDPSPRPRPRTHAARSRRIRRSRQERVPGLPGDRAVPRSRRPLQPSRHLGRHYRPGTPQASQAGVMKRPQFRATPTVYKGIRMRSRLEAGYAMWLDRQRWMWSYEGLTFGSEDGQYYPDFRIEAVTDLVTGRTAHAYVEVKPTYEGLDIHGALRRMEIIWDSEPEAHLVLQADVKPAAAPAPFVCVAPILVCLRRHEVPRVDGGISEFRGVGVALWMASRSPTLGTWLPASDGPWVGEWWKTAAGLAPTETIEDQAAAEADEPRTAGGLW